MKYAINTNRPGSRCYLVNNDSELGRFIKNCIYNDVWIDSIYAIENHGVFYILYEFDCLIYEDLQRGIDVAKKVKELESEKATILSIVRRLR